MRNNPHSQAEEHLASDASDGASGSGGAGASCAGAGGNPLTNVEGKLPADPVALTKDPGGGELGTEASGRCTGLRRSRAGCTFC